MIRTDEPSETPQLTAWRCPLCAGEQFCDLNVCNGVIMRRCADCGLFTNVTPGWDQARGGFYEGDYHEVRYGRAAARKRCVAEYLVRQIEVAQPGRGRLLDVGCALGHVVAAAQRRGWDACGVDVSAAAVARGRAEGLKLALGSLHELPYPDGHFAVVHARHVLEHDRDFRASLAELRRVLADDGVLVLAVPDGGSPKVCRRGERYAAFWVPEHLICFTQATLALALQRAGFVALPQPPLAGLGADGLSGVWPFLGWRVAEIVQDRLGLGKTLRGVWRKA